MSNLALWREIAVFWGLILEKVGPKPDFGTPINEIRPFLAVIFAENANRGEITAQKAVIRRAAGEARSCGYQTQFVTPPLKSANKSH
ncbi:hypothetical protein FRY98_23770 [Paenibacillus faecis]|uniref:Uncharacterized protein n=1 Tax=Paenibacillus faecis TaxID=862114 RepID=A0A5D0CPY4_9BACL|nr:hypothetical protein [Paenibacillus faecis]TYA10797.1 hypothetical protein FRY98_23770 [Paenibacillus faecis]